MKATLAKLPRDDAEWAFEIKWDGVRALAICATGRVTLKSRTQRDITQQYPEIGAIAASSRAGGGARRRAGRLRRGRAGRASSDCSGGSTSPRRPRSAAPQSTPVTFVVFDVLHLDGRSLLDVPYEERRERLAELELNGESWQTPSYHRGDGAAMLA